MDQDLKKMSDDVAEIKITVKKIKNHFIRQEIFSWLKIILLLVPFIIAAIYLMPMIEQAIEQYKNILNLSTGAASINPEDVNKYLNPDILKQLEALQKK